MTSGFNIFRDKILSISGTKVDLESILIAVAVVIVSYFTAKLLNLFLRKDILNRLKINKSAKRLILSLNKIVIVVIGFFIAFKVLGINLGSLAVLAGFLGVGLGFGMQNLISNFISGVIIYFEKPIKVGDYIEINNLKGYVDSIRIRTTTIVTRDNISIITPNSVFITDHIINWSHSDPKVRIHIPIGIEMTASKLPLAKSILLEIADNHPDIMKEPAPKVWFTEFAGSTFNLELIVWVDSHIHENLLKSQINDEIAQRFDESNIEISYAYQNILFRSKLSVEKAADEGKNDKK